MLRGRGITVPKAKTCTIDTLFFMMDIKSETIVNIETRKAVV
jgi:hypothetical protein